MTGSQVVQKQAIEAGARKAFGLPSPRSHIHAIFISHLHKDHINGVPELIAKYDVQRIYFPALTQLNRTVMKIAFAADDVSGFVARFCDNPRKAVDDLDAPNAKDIKLIAVGDMEGEESPRGVEAHPNGEPIRLFDFGADGQAWQNTPFSAWEYVPYNFDMKTFLGNLVQKLRPVLLAHLGKDVPLTNAILTSLFKNKSSREDVIKAYHAASGSSKEGNTNSMVVFSGVHGNSNLVQTLEDCPERKKQGKRCFPVFPLVYTAPGCLFTGDYNAKEPRQKKLQQSQNGNPWLGLVANYKTYLPFVGAIQIPHHGSAVSFNDKFISCFPKHVFHFMSCGAHDKKHPSAVVQQAFMMANKPYCLVTEDRNSLLCTIIQDINAAAQGAIVPGGPRCLFYAKRCALAGKQGEDTSGTQEESIASSQLPDSLDR